ncbi:hypothetical protein JOC54_003186 [Alkalihalobacillus xiaoxiensis]|uniref:DUF2922 family protein n=1 Tax=Shouchella xiaoxiensis TaxID=766895 RepID=A0ABS2SY03_9BACI|nr:DUF2922 domain-containing protein [Shouchella xiaoxiensis]MBM7839906.1 hypothetical protein [Shouchella xiaoxiensis]
MNETTLELRFRTAEGQLITFRVPQPKSDLTQAQISEAMDILIANNVFFGQAALIATKLDARVVTRAVDTIAV